ncbi:MAG: CHAT domain-containing protein [Thiolinea sp.]
MTVTGICRPHSNLTNTQEHFAALVELLRTGSTRLLLQKAPRTRSSVSRSYRYEAGPVLQPGAEDLALSFFGGRPVRELSEDTTQVLQVSVRAMDLRFTQHPLLCGHYLGESIAGAEYQIDQFLVHGALSQRDRLGIYAGELGTHTIVLNPRTAEERKRGSGQGAIIVGLGDWDSISIQGLTGTVRDAVLHYLLHSAECWSGEERDPDKEELLTLNSLLIGYNSTTHITVAASIEAIVLGVCEANQQYRHNKSRKQPGRRIHKLEFVEFYMDTAISAAYATRELPRRLEKDLQRLQARIVPEPGLQVRQGDGARERLSELAVASGGYWSRLMVTDADQTNDQCPADCYENWLKAPIPRPVLEAVKRQLGVAPDAAEATTGKRGQGVAERLKYVYLSERARAEAVIQQRQPGLIEALIQDSIRNSSYNPDVCRTLFQLMVPLDFKSSARQTERVLMVLDGYTANLPWEMLQADEEPLALRVAMERQLVSTRYRKLVTSSLCKTACVIGNPSTAEFHKYFDLGVELPPGSPTDLPSLGGAVLEAREVSATLREAKYEVEELFPADPDEPPSDTALDVFNILFKKPYRILMIAAHGEVRVRSRNDGKERTGVVLSGGVMLTAAEIGQMEVVPDLVFLNCCHLGKTDNEAPVSGSYNRLAYSVSRELIEMGVRCVIAAGWAVNDEAARTFSTHFFKLFTAGEPFGLAVWEARKRTYALHPNLNTWGAYQAYGDPNYVLNTDKDDDNDTEQWSPVAPQELMSRLKSLQVDIKRPAGKRGLDQEHYRDTVQRVARMLERVPPEWTAKPGIQYMLAELYGALLPEGFEPAEIACQRAIIEEDREGQVPIRALELLGNLEARQAEKLSEQAEKLRIESMRPTVDAQKKQELQQERQDLLKSAMELLDSAIARLKGLLQITHDMYRLSGHDQGENGMINSERYALLGSALKRKATVLIRHDNPDWSKVEETLKACRDYYQRGEGMSFDLNFNPYATINRLQLDGLLREPLDQHLALAEKAQAAARRKFGDSLQFFDALMVADAEIALYLLDADAFKVRLPEKYSDLPQDYLMKLYKDAFNSLSYSSSEFDSVTKQLDCLVTFLNMRAAATTDKEEAGQDRAKAAVLVEVATALKKL